MKTFHQDSEFDKNSKNRIYNLLVLQGEALIKGEFLRINSKNSSDKYYHNFFSAISNQIDLLLAYFINEEISASLENRGPLSNLIAETISDNQSDVDYKRLEIAKHDLFKLFSERTDFIIGSAIFDFRVSTYSAFEKFTGLLYDDLILRFPRSDEKERKLASLISRYAAEKTDDARKEILEKIKKISFYVSGAEKIGYILSKNTDIESQIPDAKSFLAHCQKQRNSVHNLGIHHGESDSVTVEGIDITIGKNQASSSSDYSSHFFACRKLMDIYEAMYTSVTGLRIF
ncbi:hypothetical protein [Paraburkholderia tropica]|uniref:hypothetical protein n=1 Tax=Paraburkholderia tropica TaxID=92647 RepID=UPI001F2CC076|nr:hypothetical protein [Paraburkholderia tropica]